MSAARSLTDLLGPRPRMTLVIAEAQVAEIWVEGRAPLILCHMDLLVGSRLGPPG